MRKVREIVTLHHVTHQHRKQVGKLPKATKVILNTEHIHSVVYKTAALQCSNILVAVEELQCLSRILEATACSPIKQRASATAFHVGRLAFRSQ